MSLVRLLPAEFYANTVLALARCLSQVSAVELARQIKLAYGMEALSSSTYSTLL